MDERMNGWVRNGAEPIALRGHLQDGSMARSQRVLSVRGCEILAAKVELKDGRATSSLDDLATLGLSPVGRGWWAWPT